MTWKYEIASDGSGMNVYDHTGELVQSISNDGSGFEIPADVLDVMHAEAESRGWDYSSGYVQQVLKDAAFERIEPL